MKLVGKLLAAAALVSLVACSTSPKTQVVQMGDTQLTELQIRNELSKLDDVEKQIRDNKGVTGTNVASFLFWLPGLAYTYYDAGEAMKMVEQRRSHLNALYNQQYAAKPAPAKVAAVKAPKAKSKKA